jgi:hypothetical protein
MTYHGHVENGLIVLDTTAALPNGARVRVELFDPVVAQEQAQAQRGRLAKLRREVLALPVRNPSNGFSNRDHDDVLYEEPS